MSETNQRQGRREAPGTPRRVLRCIGRTLLAVLSVAAVLLAGLCMIMDEVFNGPSETARNRLTMSLLEASATKWVPAVFVGQETVDQIQAKVAADLPEGQSDPTQVVIRREGGLEDDEWAEHPDGLRVEEVHGDTYNAYVMLIRDPARVYLSPSSKSYSKSRPGTRITKQIETEGAVAAINGGAFFDNGTISPEVGSVPCGLVVSRGEVLWNDGSSYYGFAGFNEDDILVVSKKMSAAEAKEARIRDGCCYGPVLIKDSAVNEEAYNTNSGYNPRTAIGQRADGTVILLCVDGRQAGSLGATYADVIDVMVEYGAVNACNLDGGSSTVMLLRDEEGQVQTVNNVSLLQEEPRRMPTFFMVRPLDGE
ncbi:phosphodiester glycosidase family protein [Lawsonibacter sp. JLR.KK007]|jgi:exopolysaccharide biosynthesis protein|uniref:phosphodiester glycosidase family protein n=1 Tax=Lawsonibacter sp. JLR.KK007 TaxID=3114293 RepID=UPI002FF2CD53